MIRFVVVALFVLMSMPTPAFAQHRNMYLEEVSNLPSYYFLGGCRTAGGQLDVGYLGVPEEIQSEKDKLTSKYSWAIPNSQAITEISRFSNGSAVDFGAGSGYWAMLLAEQGVDVLAIDDWSWGEPDHLWHPVKDGNEDDLVGTSDRTLIMVWPPRNEMPLDALKVWNGTRLVYVGEILRGNGTPEFFDEIAQWTLVRRIEIPNWWNRSDAVYLLEKKPGPKWLPDPVSVEAGCKEH